MTDAASNDSSNVPSERPSMVTRQSTAPIVVPADHPEIEAKPKTYPPGDARAMSPRQSNDNLDAFCGRSRDSIESTTLQHQAGLAAILEKIEEVKTSQEKLERDNVALQEYIGGLTRSMSRTDMTTGRKR